eukprot:symbB.v1.2.019078.t1/scaffold1542.1/size112718/13
MASLLQNDDGQSQSQAHFMRVLKFTAAAISCAGTATLQARQLLITQTAAPFGENALTQATSGLATAYSLGSVVEFFLSPTFGRLSDRFGRKPMMLFLMVGPALMRAMCALVKKPFFRIRLLWLDFASARAVGIQPFMGMCGTMISDVYSADDQPAARSQLAASQAFGSIIGNYLSGWWNGKAGPESTYLCTAAVPMMSLLFASVCLRETNKNIKQDVPIREATIKEKPSASKSYLKLLSDPECCLLAGALGLYEFMNYPPLNSVSILFMKERFNWGPLEAGRFASGHALAVFSGSLLAGRLIQVFGKQLYVSLTNLFTAVAFLTWATASNGWSLVASLLPLSFGTGGNSVLLTRFVERAVSLGWTKGEATGVIQAVGAVGRMAAPQLFIRLWLRAVAQKGQRGALPLGAPMLSVSAIALLQEILYRCSLLVRSP